jgi:hypothetical protein
MKFLDNLLAIALLRVGRLWSMEVDSMPSDCWVKIFYLLESRHIPRISLVSQELYRIAAFDEVWLMLV